MNIVFDLDGTICFNGRSLSKEVTNALQEMQAYGHRVIFASARPIRDMLPVLATSFHSNTLIGGNGSLISQHNKIISSKSFSQEELGEIKKLLVTYEATYLIDGEWDYTYTGAADHPILANVDTLKFAKQVPLDSHDKVIKILVLGATNMEDLAISLRNLNVVVHTHGRENVLDISPQHIHKFAALEEIGIAQEGYVAFGNDANDIEMFKGAAHSIMIGHHDGLSAYANESIVIIDFDERPLLEKIEELSMKFDINAITG